MMNESQLRDAFTRQRRNLMAVSLILLFIEVADVAISPTGTLFGIPITIGNPVAVTWALWIGFAYWLWRYSVYFHDLSDRGFLKAYRHRLEYLVHRIARRRVKDDSRIAEALAKKGLKLTKVLGAGTVDLNPWRYQVRVTFSASKTDQPGLSYQRDDLYTVDDVKSMLLANLRAWMHVILIRHLFSEYLLPFVVAGSPILYNAYTLIYQRGV